MAWNKDIAELIRQHNDANALVLPGRFVDNKTAEKINGRFFSRQLSKVDVMNVVYKRLILKNNYQLSNKKREFLIK